MGAPHAAVKHGPLVAAHAALASAAARAPARAAASAAFWACIHPTYQLPTSVAEADSYRERQQADGDVIAVMLNADRARACAGSVSLAYHGQLPTEELVCRDTES